MTLADYSKDLRLHKFLKRLGAGHTLFRQEENGSSTFIIVEGVVDLYEERNGVEVNVGSLKTGDFLGEKAILSANPYLRGYTAKTKTTLVYLEFRNQDMSMIATAIPDFWKFLLQTALRRLIEANFLVRVLRSRDDATELIHCILYLSRFNGRKTAEGIQFELTTELVFYYLDIDRTKIETYLRELVRLQVIIPQANGQVLLIDENRLLQSIPLLQKRITEGLSKAA